MGKSCIGLVVGVAVLLGMQTAQAGTLTSATLHLHIPQLPPALFSVTGLASAGTATGSGATAAWNAAAGVLPTGVHTTSVPVTAAPPVTGISFVINGNPLACAFAGTTGGLCKITGVANLKAPPPFITLLKVPLSVGSPATLVPPVVGGIGVTAFANAWTTKTTGIHLTANQAPTPSASVTQMGVNSLVGGAGTVVLVTALSVVAAVTGQLPSFAFLTLNYAAAPEPGTLMLLGSGVAGLVVLGLRKLRK